MGCVRAETHSGDGIHDIGGHIHIGGLDNSHVVTIFGSVDAFTHQPLIPAGHFIQPDIHGPVRFASRLGQYTGYTKLHRAADFIAIRIIFEQRHLDRFAVQFRRFRHRVTGARVGIIEIVLHLRSDDHRTSIQCGDALNGGVSQIGQVIHADADLAGIPFQILVFHDGAAHDVIARDHFFHAFNGGKISQCLFGDGRKIG